MRKIFTRRFTSFARISEDVPPILIEFMDFIILYLRSGAWCERMESRARPCFVLSQRTNTWLYKRAYIYIIRKYTIESLRQHSIYTHTYKYEHTRSPQVLCGACFSFWPRGTYSPRFIPAYSAPTHKRARAPTTHAWSHWSTTNGQTYGGILLGGTSHAARVHCRHSAKCRHWKSHGFYMFIHTFKCAAVKNIEQEVFGSPCALIRTGRRIIFGKMCAFVCCVFSFWMRDIADSMVHKIEKFHKRNYTGGGGAAVSNTYIERTIKYLFIVYTCICIYERKTNKSDVCVKAHIKFKVHLT